MMYGWPEGKSHYFVGRRDVSNVWDDLDTSLGSAQLDSFDGGFNLTVELNETAEADGFLDSINKSDHSDLSMGLFTRPADEYIEGTRHYNVGDMIWGPSNVWNIPKPRNNKEHPTMKPLELQSKAIKYSRSRSNEIERYCWMVVHEYRHGVMPVEYDIREIDEDLYMDVLNCAQSKLNLPLKD